MYKYDFDGNKYFILSEVDNKYIVNLVKNSRRFGDIHSHEEKIIDKNKLYDEKLEGYESMLREQREEMRVDFQKKMEKMRYKYNQQSRDLKKAIMAMGHWKDNIDKDKLEKLINLLTRSNRYFIIDNNNKSIRVIDVEKEGNEKYLPLIWGDITIRGVKKNIESKFGYLEECMEDNLVSFETIEEVDRYLKKYFHGIVEHIINRKGCAFPDKLISIYKNISGEKEEERLLLGQVLEIIRTQNDDMFKKEREKRNERNIENVKKLEKVISS